MQLHVPPALRHRNFRLIWLGMMISTAGTEMQVWALLWHINQIDKDPIWLGLMGAVRFVPIFIFSLIGGALADVLDRRRLMFITQSSMALAALALAILSFTGRTALWHIYLLTALQATAVAFDSPARQALVPSLVPANRLPSAFSLTSIAWRTGAILGPALNGLVIASLGLPFAYLFNAISYLAVLAALLLMEPLPQPVPRTRRAEVSLAAIKDGLRFIRRQPVILSTMIMDFFATFFSSANTLMPVIAREILHVGVIQYGWLSAAQAIGAVTAALALSQVEKIPRQGKVFLAAVVIFGLATVLLGLSGGFAIAMLALILIGASDSVSTVIRNTLRQLQTPDHLRGRMTSVNQLFFMGGPQLGEIEAGLVAQLFGAPAAIVSGGIGCLLAVAWIVRRWPQLRFYNGDEPVLAGSVAD